MIKKIILLVMKPTILVGGQAVIEGVMMRVPGAYATAVRDPDGKIHIDRKNFQSLGEKSWFWKYLRKDLSYYSIEVYSENVKKIYKIHNKLVKFLKKR